jgi:hypothetical protein
VVVGPCNFEAMRKQLDGLRSAGTPDQKADGGGAEFTHPPQSIFHWIAPSFVLMQTVWNMMRL